MRPLGRAPVSSFVVARGLDDLHGEAADVLADPRPIHSTIAPEPGTGPEAFWLVAVDSPELSTALLAQHVGGDLWARALQVRQYAGYLEYRNRARATDRGSPALAARRALARAA